MNIMNELELMDLCYCVKCNYIIFVEEESIIFDNFNDFKNNSKLYDSKKPLNCYSITLTINGPFIQINVYKCPEYVS